MNTYVSEGATTITQYYKFNQCKQNKGKAHFSFGALSSLFRPHKPTNVSNMKSATDKTNRQFWNHAPFRPVQNLSPVSPYSQDSCRQRCYNFHDKSKNHKPLHSVPFAVLHIAISADSALSFFFYININIHVFPQVIFCTVTKQ